VPYRLFRIREAAQRPLLAGLLSYTEELWSSRDKWPRAERGKNLLATVKYINWIADQMGIGEKLAGSFQVKPDEIMPLSNYPEYSYTVGKAIELLGKNLGKFDADAIGGLFPGYGAEAAKRIEEIVRLLQALYKRKKTKKNLAGFVVDSGMHEGAAALATRLDDGSGYIRLSKRALDRNPSIDVLAYTLIHEGSHVINEPTVDFAYRDSDQHLFLPPKLKLYNAPNYEKAAIDILRIEEKKPERKEEIEEKKAGGKEETEEKKEV